MTSEVSSTSKYNNHIGEKKTTHLIGGSDLVTQNTYYYRFVFNNGVI